MEEKLKKENSILEFLIKTLNGMAYGLFATLIIGTIFATIGGFFKAGSCNGFCDFMFKVLGDGKTGLSYVLQILTGAGIGVGIALALKFDALKVIVLAAAGEVGGFFSLSTKAVENGKISDFLVGGGLKVGDPLTIYLVCIGVALLIKFALAKKTPVDILLIPLFGGIAALVTVFIIRFPAIYFTYYIQMAVNFGTNTVPFIMGIIVAVIMGMALTAPISSAAIAAMIFVLPDGVDIITALSDPNMSGLVIASGAAVIGCSTQMVGFAIQSRKDNNIGMIFSIGIGTSMLQFKNILKKPIVWLPTIIASAILGPVSTCLVKVYCMGASAGMGTAGLVGQIGTISSMGVNSWQTWVGIFGLEIIAPIVLVFLIDLLFRKLGWIKDGDLKV